MQTISDRLRSSANMCTRVNAAVTLLCEAALDGADELDRVTKQRNDLLDRLDLAQAEIRALESKLLDATTKPIRICESCAIYPCKCE